MPLLPAPPPKVYAATQPLPISRPTTPLLAPVQQAQGSASQTSTSVSKSGKAGSGLSTSVYSRDVDQLRCLNARGTIEAVRGGKIGFPTSVAWNATGTHLAAGFNDNFIRVWSLRALEKEEMPLVLTGHTDSVDQVIFHPIDEHRIATASLDKTVRVWDIRSGKCLHTILTGGQNINMAWSHDGAALCVGSKEDSLTFIDAQTWKIIDTVTFPYEVNEMAWDRKCSRLILAQGQQSAGGIQVLEYPSKVAKASIRGHMSACTTIDFSPDGRHFATGGTDALICLWDATELSCIRTWGALEWPIRSLAFSHNSELLAVVSEDNFLLICNVETGHVIHKLTTELGGMHSVAWHPSRLVLAFAGDKSRGETRRSADAVGVRVLGL